MLGIAYFTHVLVMAYFIRVADGLLYIYIQITDAYYILLIGYFEYVGNT